MRGTNILGENDGCQVKQVKQLAWGRFPREEADPDVAEKRRGEARREFV
jgi:hypothetical protein